MTRSQILQVAKPILFNTEMVRAIFDGRKTVTRRVIKGQIEPDGDRVIYRPYKPIVVAGKEYESVGFSGGVDHFIREKAPYKPGDYLYVRETWSPMYPDEKSNDVVGYMYRADEGMSVSEYDRRHPNGKDYQWPGIWKPSIHMPKEAARIFLRVTMDVRVERLKDMTADSAMSEGFTDWNDAVRVWDSTIPPKDRNKYGWAANPYVFVIEFERVEVTE